MISSQSESIFSRIPETSFPKIKQIFHISFQKKLRKSFDFSQVSRPIIVNHWDFRVFITASVSSKYSQSIVCSAQSAVFEISFRGGVGVYPQSKSFSNPAPSAFRKIAPTFCKERIESRRIILFGIDVKIYNLIFYTNKALFCKYFHHQTIRKIQKVWYNERNTLESLSDARNTYHIFHLSLLFRALLPRMENYSPPWELQKKSFSLFPPSNTS